ncbi:MAG TPA: sensory rhodopsin transducer [Propionicimonas sp.]
MTSVNSVRAPASSAGLRRWYVPDAYIPPASTAPETSHESICVLNDNDEPAVFTVTAYFADRGPQRSSELSIEGNRAVHLRTDLPAAVGGLQLERGVPYGLVIESAAQLHVQYSRLDTTQAAYTLMTALLGSEVTSDHD